MMSDDKLSAPEGGLCTDCHSVRVLVTGKGSRFFYCLRSEVDAHYPRYPRVPVQQCAGYESKSKVPVGE
jgi:hypothetical protein